MSKLLKRGINNFKFQFGGGFTLWRYLVLRDRIEFKPAFWVWLHSENQAKELEEKINREQNSSL